MQTADEDLELKRHRGLRLKNGMVYHHLPKFYFLHIPKTAGTSFRTWLSELYDTEDLLPSEHLPELEAVGPQALRDYRFFSGHFGWRLMEMAEAVGESVVPITILREPSELYGSGWTYTNSLAEEDIKKLGPQVQRRMRKTKSLVAEKNSEANSYSSFSNIMVRYLAHHGTEVRAPVTVTEVLLETAKQRLAAMAFFGLVEDWSRSAVLFADAFRLPLRTIAIRENASEKGDEDRYNSEFVRLSLADNDLDVQLYSHAKQLFKERYRHVAEKFGLPHSAEPEDFREALKQQFLEEGKQIRQSSRIQSASIPMAARIITRGLPFRYDDHSWGGYCLWAGPDLDSSIFLPLNRSRPLSLRLSFKIIMSSAIRSGMEVRVDGNPAKFELRYEKDKDGKYFDVGIVNIPAAPASSSPGYTEISIHVPETVYAPGPAFRTGVSYCLGGDLVIAPIPWQTVLLTAARRFYGRFWAT